MKLNHSKQLALSVCLIILFNVLDTVLKHWIFHTIGFCVVGLLWIIHPVMKNDKTPTKKEKNIIRLAGFIIILLGLFSRAYLY